MHPGAPLFVFLTALAFAESQAATPTSPQTPPNILFIAVDDLRPALGAYGDPLAITPHLDRLARSGVTFERAYCQQAVCSPSRISLLTGLRPDTTGIYDLQTHHRTRVPDLPVIPQWFREHGYLTVGRGKIFHGKLDDPLAWDSPPSELKLSGTLYALPANRDPAPIELGRPQSRGPAWEIADVPDETYGDGIIARDAVDFLRHRRPTNRPFFLALGFLKPHLPFNAPKRYWDLHDPEKLWPPSTRSLPVGTPDWVSQPGWELRNAYSGVPADYTAPIPEETQKKLRHGYYAATSFVDAQIGKVLTALDELGLSENTIVILWGDHGYHLGEHGTWCKHSNFEEAVHAPLLLRVPGRAQGARVPAPVEFLDVYPTLVQLAGLPAPSHLEGRSLAPFLEDPKRPADKPAFSQYPRGSEKTNNPMMGYSITDGRWRYTEWLRTDTGERKLRELYDLANDPHITRNIADDPTHASTIEELAAQLLKAGRQVERYRALSSSAGSTSASRP